MLLPLAFVFIIAFIIVALWLIFRQSKGKNETRGKR